MPRSARPRFRHRGRRVKYNGGRALALMRGRSHFRSSKLCEPERGRSVSMPKIVRFHETGTADVLALEDAPPREPDRAKSVSRSRRSASIVPRSCIGRAGIWRSADLPSLIGYEVRRHRRCRRARRRRLADRRPGQHHSRPFPCSATASTARARSSPPPPSPPIRPRCRRSRGGDLDAVPDRLRSAIDTAGSIGR